MQQLDLSVGKQSRKAITHSYTPVFNPEKLQSGRQGSLPSWEEAGGLGQDAEKDVRFCW